VNRWGASLVQVACAWPALLLLGCVDGDPAGTSASRSSLAQALGRYCDVECRRFAQCLSGVSERGCNSYCRADMSLGRIASATLVSVAGCFEQAACSEFVDESVYDTCFDQAAATTEPTERCQEYCVLDVTQSFECGGGYDVAICLSGGVCSWSDPVLVRAIDCQDLDCEERQTCLNDVFEITE
jgi:hypothetical protein